MELGASTRRVIVATLLALVLAAAMLGVQLASLPPDDGPGLPQARMLSRTDVDAKERLLVRGDGQFFAALSTDPSMSRPEVLRKDRSGYAYRWIRPLYSWLGWVESLGQPSAVPSALIGLTILSAGFLVAGAATLAQTLGRDPLWGLACLLLPGTVVILQWTGPEVLASGLALAASSTIVGQRRATAATITLLVLSVLARETLILMCLGLAVWLWADATRRSRASAVAVILGPAAALAAWLFVVRWRIGSSPFEEGGDLLTTPFAGLIDAAPNWSQESAVMMGVMAIVLACGLLRAGPHRGAVLTIVAPTLILAIVLDEPVWGRWEDIGRILLPACAVLLVASLPSADRGTRRHDEVGPAR